MSYLTQALAKTVARAGLLASLVVAVLAVSGVGASSASAACVTPKLIGQGSSLQKIAQQQVWIPSFEETCLTSEEPGVEYESTGSGPGLAAWRFTGGPGAINTGRQFIGTDDAPNTGQIIAGTTASGSAVAVVPVAQTAIAVVVDPPA